MLAPTAHANMSRCCHAGIEDLPDDNPAGRRSGRATPEDEEPFSDEDDFIDDDLGGGQAGQRRRRKRFGGGSRLSNKAMQVCHAARVVLLACAHALSGAGPAKGSSTAAITSQQALQSGC